MPQVRDIRKAISVQRKLLTIREDETVAQAASLMEQTHVGCLIVTGTKKKLAGIISERDILQRVVAGGLEPHNVLIKDIMTSQTYSCSLDTPLSKIEEMMGEHRIRHLPVVKDGTPIGMISTRDIINYRLSSNKQMKVAAEKLMKLSTEFGPLGFDAFVNRALQQIPRSFNAERALLRLKSPQNGQPAIFTNNCPLQEDEFDDADKILEAGNGGWVIFGNICKKCRKLGARGPRITVPLNTQANKKEGAEYGLPSSYEGFLCLCSFKHPSTEGKNVQIYKAGLLQEILNANLTNAALYADYRKAKQQSETDSLTGLATRRILMRALRSQCTKSARNNTRFALAMVDIDKFKNVNDTAGHAVGDQTLQTLGRLIHQNIRENDLAIRYGGDEFAIIMPQTDAEGAARLLQRLRESVKQISIPYGQSITISVGIAEFVPSNPQSPEDLLVNADRTLYRAKSKGRDCIVSTA